MDFEHEFDVVVAGGGVAGVAAAVESSRSGLKTALVEKTILTGGLATSGLINVYLPLCDGRGTQVSRGIAEELLYASIKYGPGEVPPGWRDAHDKTEPERYRVAFSPAAFVLALDELLVEAGVQLWLDTLATAPVMDGNRLAGIEVENKSGRGRLRAKCVVDATGDADVAARAGAECALADNWLAMWALQASLKAAERATAEGNATPLLEVKILGADNAGRGEKVPTRKWRGTSGRDVTEFVLESRKLLRDDYARQRAGSGGRHNVFPLALPTMAQLRTSRRIVGKALLSAGGCGRRAEDSVGLAADWRKPGCVWEIPYGTLVPEKVDGLLTAGRCISSEGDAWEVTRVIPAAAVTGQAAGVAATLSAQTGKTPGTVDVRDIQDVLARKGIPLHLRDVGLGDTGA